MSQFKVSCRLPAMLSTLFHSKGINFDNLLQAINYDQQVNFRDEFFLSVDEYFQFWRVLESVSENPLIGLEIGMEIKPETFDPVFLAALASNSYQDALSRFARYKQLLYPANIEIIQKNKEVLIYHQWPIQYGIEPTILADAEMAFVLRLGRLGTQKKVQPVRIELTRDALPAGYRNKVGCKVKLKAKNNVLVIDEETYQKPFLTANQGLLDLLDDPLIKKLDIQSGQVSISQQVKQVLVNIITGQKPSLERVAGELAMSPRSLQRKLKEEGNTFNNLLIDVRKELASYYMKHKKLQKSEVAYLLGFDSVNSFYRAYQKW
ncbi:AraC family transcriptional regulator ligand-binding domain-containing protein [Endozoicomonas sp. SM1973]|uniref:AraC family transcriptional regulator ligand-binding domain-containing protein n=1 Tax=Spartinivicinus marinus TaxID=2994442 RepID=A0A853IBR8_9GAMM|nr:AraC family transcriptional regulator [Spartinivicinus marinus]MCX4029816.1 AraC family transcriptional regulator ligand-binding domain-containing protein [Spartinivicinus marinus]NYZ67514.1 AraC family transcriptional regulator ligand-binding domain-containing protein [Spartinivicinus marinus]